MIMGGFTYIDGGVESVLHFDHYRRLLGIDFSGQQVHRPPLISFPMITTTEIHDKARGDFLSKAIVILQSLWFIIQCVARGKQGLALTELELVTVALASLNGVMYFFWWDKPLGVNEPVKLYREGHEPPKKFIGEEGSKQDVSIEYCHFVKCSEHLLDIQRRKQLIEDSSKRSLVQKLMDIEIGRAS